MAWVLDQNADFRFAILVLSFSSLYPFHASFFRAPLTSRLFSMPGEKSSFLPGEKCFLTRGNSVKAPEGGGALHQKCAWTVRSGPFSDRALNEWPEILISTPKLGNWNKFWPLNEWNYYPIISLFWLCQTQKFVSFILVHFYVILVPFLSCLGRKFRLMAQSSWPIRTLTRRKINP